MVVTVYTKVVDVSTSSTLGAATKLAAKHRRWFGLTSSRPFSTLNGRPPLPGVPPVNRKSRLARVTTGMSWSGRRCTLTH